MADDEYVQNLQEKLANVDLSDDDKEKLIDGFLIFDTNRNCYVEFSEVTDLLQKIGKAPAAYKVREMLKSFNCPDQRLTPDQFAKVYKELCKDKTAEQFRSAVTTRTGHITTTGTATSEGTQHSYSPEEKVAFCNWINQNLKDDPDLETYNLPIDPSSSSQFFQALSDGVILCKLINLSQKDTIDERAINKKKSNNKAVQIHRDQENLNLALGSASAIGCSIVNIGANDIKDQKAHLILGLLWQVIRIGLFAAFDLARSPDLYVLLREGEELEDLMNLSPELLLLRWINYHLDKSERYQNYPGKRDEITNFGSDIKDSIAYMCLLEQIQPQEGETGYTGDMVEANVNIHPGTDKENMTKRAAYMLRQADKINAKAFVSEHDVYKGNTKLNMAFVAHLFNTYPCLHDTSEREIIVETREEKTYRNWMNSLGVAPRVNRIHYDLRDGKVYLQLFDKVQPGLVKQERIPKPTTQRAKETMNNLMNCNYVVELGKEQKYSLVGIGGDNFRDGDERANLALSWQLMRGYTMSVLKEIGKEAGNDKIDDKAIIGWVNNKLKESGKLTSISSFKDSTISSSKVVIDLVDAIGGSGTIDYSLVCDGDDESSRESNARYAISMARKIGARVYALPDDLWEVNPKMIMTIFACLMARDMQREAQRQQQ